MIESKTLGDAVGIQRDDVTNNSKAKNWTVLADGVIIGRFKRGRMDKPFTVTSTNYEAMLGDDPLNPSFVVVDDAFRRGASQLTIVRLGNPLLATAQGGDIPIEPPKPVNKLAKAVIQGVLEVGKTLTGVVTDPNGVPINVTYRWLADGVQVGSRKNHTLTILDNGKSMSLHVAFIDNDGYAESVISATTEPVKYIPVIPVDPVIPNNTAASVAINGILKAGETLTAIIVDPNGVPSKVIYEWLANGVTVSTKSTYSLTEGDSGKTIVVRVSFTDGDGYAESAISAISAPVAGLNKPASVTIQGVFKVGERLTSTVTDPNGVPANITYRWMANGVQVGTASSYPLIESDKGKVITLRVSFTDNNGFAETVTSAASVPVAPLNKSASVAINGVLRVGQTLTANISDANGVPSNVTYRWLADGVEISTASSHVLREVDKGKAITLSVTFIDNDGFMEAASSEPSVPVAALNKPSSVVINGTPKVGNTLTSTIDDANGVPSNVVYQWLSSGIQVGTESSYTLGESDKGRIIALSVAFTDDDGFAETVTIAMATPVIALNKPASVTINGIFTVGQNLTATIDDANGVPSYITYEWMADGAQVGTASSHLLTNNEKNKAITLRVTFIDKDGFTETAISPLSERVLPLNKPATIAIDGVFRVGETLTSAITDANGVPASVAYEWMADGAQVGTESSYRLTETDKGKILTLRVIFTDNDGFSENAISEESEPVLALNAKAAVSVDGIFEIGQTLTSTVSDPNGVPSIITYQWLADGVQVGTESSYTLTTDDSYKSITLRVTFTDNDGFAENAISKASPLVKPIRPTQEPPVVLAAGTPFTFRTVGDVYDKELALSIKLFDPTEDWALYDATSGELLSKLDFDAEGVEHTGNMASKYIKISVFRSAAATKNSSYRLVGGAKSMELYYDRSSTEPALVPDGSVFVDSFSSDIGQYFFSINNANLTVPNKFPSHITRADSMFAGSTLFNQDISGWNICNVTTLDRMFYQCYAFNQPIGNWDTSNVIYMNEVFGQAHSFNQPLTHWDTINVIDMAKMFLFAYVFNQPIGHWNVSKVRFMDQMFGSSNAFYQDLSKWCVVNIETMASFADAANDWLRPVWGTCPRGENVPL